MPQYLYRIMPTRSTMLTEGLNEREAAAMSDHFAYLERLRDAGVVILAGRTLNTDSTSFGVVIFNAPSEAEALEIVRNDPGVSRDVVRPELFPYRVALISEANADSNEQ